MLHPNVFNASELAQRAEFHLQLFLPLQHLRALGEELAVAIAQAHQAHLRPEVEQPPPQHQHRTEQQCHPDMPTGDAPRPSP